MVSLLTTILPSLLILKTQAICLSNINNSILKQLEQANESDSFFKNLLLGEGASGKVYKVYYKKDKNLENQELNISLEPLEGYIPVAIKIYKDKPDPLKFDFMKRETFLLDIFKQNKINDVAPMLYLCGATTDNIRFAVMELLSTTLSDYINTNTLSFYDRLIVSFGIFKTLSKLHEYSIAHCDIKMENIAFNDPKIEVKLIDYDRSVFNNNRCNKGTYQYMAPEVYQPNQSKVPGTMSDTFSASVIMLGIEKNNLENIGNVNKMASKDGKRNAFQEYINHKPKTFVYEIDRKSILSNMQPLVMKFINKYIDLLLAALSESPDERPSSYSMMLKIKLISDSYVTLENIIKSKKVIDTEAVEAFINEMSNWSDDIIIEKFKEFDNPNLWVDSSERVLNVNQLQLI